MSSNVSKGGQPLGAMIDARTQHDSSMLCVLEMARITVFDENSKKKGICCR